MCQHCGTEGACICRAPADGPATPETAGTGHQPARTLNDRIRRLRRWVADFEQSLTEMRAELADLLRQAGRRPGDGSDQPQLFGDETQPGLF